MKKNNPTAVHDTNRRSFIAKAGAVAATAAIAGAPAILRAQTVPIRIGYWPVAAGLPFYAAVEAGYFKQAGLEVQALKFAGAQQVIARNDMVRVTYQVGGVNLAVMGKAMRSAGLGEPVAIMNTTSNRVIDAVASGPGQAVAGPAADAARAAPQQFAAR